MPRPIAPRSAAAHVATLGRIQRQVEVDGQISKDAKTEIYMCLGELIALFQAQVSSARRKSA